MALRKMTVQLNQCYQGFKASSWGQMPGLSVIVELSLLGHFQWGASDPVCQIICCNPLLSYLTGARCPARWLHTRKRNTVSLPLSVLPACLCGTVTQGTDHSRLSASMLNCPLGLSLTCLERRGWAVDHHVGEHQEPCRFHQDSSCWKRVFHMLP